MKLFNRKNDDFKNLPILIIPGFMSSGLEVRDSDIRESWIGQRIWLNLKNLGFESFSGGKNSTQSSNQGNTSTSGGSGNQQQQQQQPPETQRSTTSRFHASGKTSSNILQDWDDDIESGSRRTTNKKLAQELEAERERAMFANAWIHHMSLQDDLETEREGIIVRPIEGLSGVDYLAPGLLTSHVSYVFGPVIQALLRVGYEKELNLDAAPYDWRIPPSVLESRDKYFTQTMDKIEQLYTKNDNTPVVLLCHSMGCKIGHYLLNFAHKKRGQAWLDKYVHTYMPVGAPHLGAPKALRSLISGDKMGLETFLTDADALIMGRSLGSAPFLLPTDLPSGASGTAFFRMDGAMEVSVTTTIDTEVFLKRREDKHRPAKLRLTVVSGGKAITTPYQFIDENQKVKFSETFTFRTEADGPTTRQGLTIMVCEPGVRGARASTTKTRTCHLNCRKCFFNPWKIYCKGEEARWGRPPKDNKVLFWLNIITFWWLIYPLVRYSIEYSFKIFFGVVYGVFACLFCGTVASVDKIAKASNGSSVLAIAKYQYIRPQIIHGGGGGDEEEGAAARANEVDLQSDLIAASDLYRCCGCCLKKREFGIKVKVKWIPPKATDRPRNIHRQAICQPDAKVRPIRGFLKSAKGDKKKYAVRSGHDILDAERLSRVVENMDRAYENDPIDPRGVAPFDPPPVRTIKAIYGVNLPTEVGTIFKRRHAILGNSQQIDNKLKPDTKVSLKGNDGDHVVKQGVLYELGSESETSGDGTVPYWSLSHVKTWEKHCQVTVHEIEGAEHREILSDKRLHDILIEYCCKKDDSCEIMRETSD